MRIRILYLLIPVSFVWSRRKLALDWNALGSHPTDLQQAQLLERRNRLTRRIAAWVEIQTLYIPGVSRVRQGDPLDTQTAETTPLHMPSTIFKKISVNRRLVKQEAQYREAQALAALDGLRGHLIMLDKMYTSKDQLVQGQRPNTRSKGLIDRMQAKIQLDKARYRNARTRLVAMKDLLGQGEWEKSLKTLEEKDVKGLGKSPDEISEGRRVLSWIWKGQGVVGDDVANTEDGRQAVISEGIEEGQFSFYSYFFVGF